MTKLPRITVTSEAGGWLIECTCGATSFQTRRPAADKWAHDHAKTHGGTGR